MLELKNISKGFVDFSLRDVSFSVEKGDYFILLGESGAGKSMILETIAGLVQPDSGELILEGRDITREKIQNRKIGLVFQDHAVFPHMTVAENIAFALHSSKISPVEKHEKVKAIAGELGIADLLHRKPATLSGGELQRVALGRTLIQQPAILLLDEPLASLDSRLKGDLRRLLRTIHRKGQTILHVTHDYEEALSLGTKIAVIHQGSIIQAGAPEQVFNHPKSSFVAHFIGVKNFFPVTLTREKNMTLAMTSNNIPVHIVTDMVDGEGYIIIRGEDILLSSLPVETSATNNFEGTIVDIVQKSSDIEVSIDIGFEIHARITMQSRENLRLEPGRSCWVHFKATAVRYISK